MAFSPDGKTILTSSQDKSTRFWDAATGRLIGPPVEHANQVYAVAYSPDGRTLFTGSSNNMSRLWEALAPPPDDVPRLSAWIETLTGLELDEEGAVRLLDNAAWRGRRERLEQLGGPPPDPAPLLDPIVFGDEPAARGDAMVARGERDRAETAYGEAVRARPLNRSVRDALARLQASRGHPDRAAGTWDEAVRLDPDDIESRRRLALALLVSGHRTGWRRQAAELLERSAGMTDFRTAMLIAEACAWGPDALNDPTAPVRLAEAVVGGLNPAISRADAMSTLGSALYRAGRSDDAIRRLEEAIRVRGGKGAPRDWVFLAMAHHRLGHRDEARRWLERLRGHQPSNDPAQFWDELEIRLLGSEAEALILYDPEFPDDPFAR
jgi:tetratricopeptide (TPR) repeat protein